VERITKISLGRESSGGEKYKIVETTTGNFKTRCYVYNQNMEGKIQRDLIDEDDYNLFLPSRPILFKEVNSILANNVGHKIN